MDLITYHQDDQPTNAIWVLDKDHAPISKDEEVATYDSIVFEDSVGSAVFDLTSIPAEANDANDLKVFRRLLAQEAFSVPMIYVGKPTRNLVVPKDAVPLRTNTELILTGFVSDGGKPMIKGKAVYRPGSVEHSMDALDKVNGLKVESYNGFVVYQDPDLVAGDVKIEPADG